MGHEKDNMFEEVLESLIYLCKYDHMDIAIDEHGIVLHTWDYVDGKKFESTRSFTLKEIKENELLGCLVSFIKEFYYHIEKELIEDGE